MVHTLAEKLGEAEGRRIVATFMPKPFSHLTGNGAHFHMSLWDGDTNLFLDENDSRHGLGLSETAYQFIGGLKKHARAYSAITAPTVNSYKRLKLGSTTSGATWSPVWISYGYNNRTQMLRIPAPGRIEDRTIDGSCNPYLAAAAILAAGMDGIENDLDAGEPNSENLYTKSYEELAARGLESLPRNLYEATVELEADDVLRKALGRGRDEDYVDYFIRVKRDEWARYHEQVTPWEINEYLTRF
jgi:glutamine synthetase